MPAYRFCRPDDVSYLVQAVNACYDVYYPDRPHLTLAHFKEEMKELNLWPSNCMVAASDADPIGVLIAAKRDKEVLILRLGVRPDSVRQGHGSHMVSSLAQKLAVLGPPRLIAEVPAEAAAASHLLESLGFVREIELVDYRLPTPLGPEPEGTIFLSASLEELIEGGLLEEDADCGWERQLATLRQRSASLRASVLATADAVSAFLVTRLDTSRGENEICAWRVFDADHSSVLISLLLRYHAQQGCPYTLAKASIREGRLFEDLGFNKARHHIRFARKIEDE